MNPAKYYFTIYRGADFDITLLAQSKEYKFDTESYSAGKAKRSLAENLEYYGYTYQYINFITNYDDARMIIRTHWNGGSNTILTLTLENGGLVLTDQGIRIIIPAEMTKAITVDTATYELDLLKEDKVDRFIYGDIDVLGEGG